MKTRYSYGWRPSPPDIRDKRYSAPQNVVASLPRSVDLSTQFPMPYNQRRLGSCVYNALAGVIQQDQMRQGLSLLMPSRLFMYYNGRSLEGTTMYDSGSSVRSGLKAVVRWGFCREEAEPGANTPFWPYDDTPPLNPGTPFPRNAPAGQKPPQSCFDAAKANTITDYAAVDQTPDQVRGTIAAGKGVVIGFTCYPELESDETARTGYVPMPSAFEAPIGGHSVVLTAYDDALAKYRFRNSWDQWGDHGYGTIDYDYVHNPRLSGDFWVINTVPGAPKPVPPTPPTPPLPVNPVLLTLSVDLKAGVYRVVPN